MSTEKFVWNPVIIRWITANEIETPFINSRHLKAKGSDLVATLVFPCYELAELEIEWYLCRVDRHQAIAEINMGICAK